MSNKFICSENKIVIYQKKIIEHNDKIKGCPYPG